MARSINIVYFAWVKERLGKAEEQVQLPANVQSISDLVEFLRRKDAVYGGVLSDVAKLRFALDQDFALYDAPLDGSKELAIFPPVTGG